MFESSEKKIEIIFSPDSLSLFKKPESFWKDLLDSCNAKIVSKSVFPKIHSYILFESTLLIWSHRLVLITCGNTMLFKAFIKIINSFPKAGIQTSFFQRKKEYFPQQQKSCFYKDIKNIKPFVDGTAYRFGPFDSQHFFLFHSAGNKNLNTSTPSSIKEQTLEILMYDSKLYKDSSAKTILKLKQALNNDFPKFQIQEHAFVPKGYSLNAIKDHFYYTIHITPQKSSFYISFETNIKDKSIQILTQKILNIFQPNTFDFILFKSGSENQQFKKQDFISQSYNEKYAFYKSLSCNYDVTYKYFYKTDMAQQASHNHITKKQAQWQEASSLTL